MSTDIPTDTPEINPDEDIGMIYLNLIFSFFILILYLKRYR